MSTDTSRDACCSIPPVEVDYTPKGSYVAFGGFKKVYVVGPKSDKALLAAYDIFGFTNQALQGADILSSALNVQVYMPDFFEPFGPLPVEYYPPDTDEKKKAFGEFFAGPADPHRVLPFVKNVTSALKADGITKIGAYGYCWGGKIVTLTSGANTDFVAVASVHPAMLAVADFEALTVPLGLFPSKDESAEECDKAWEVVKTKPFASLSVHKRYVNMRHGWAAARADLNDPANKAAYEDVYKQISTFFHKVISA